MNNYDNAKQRILLVEDDEELAGLIKEYLESAEFNVDIQAIGTGAVERILDINPDLVILDLMLPGKDGISICRDVRALFANPILMLTASNESVDHIIGLEVGADDFMHKPVEPRILLAHVRALLRRATPQASQAQHASNAQPANSQSDNYEEVSPQTIQHQETSPRSNTLQAATSEDGHLLCFGDVVIDMNNRHVKLSGQPLALTTPEYDTLILLAARQGTILSRDKLFQLLRGIDYDGQNRLVDITICQLRAKLGVDGHSHRHIQTIRNKGYVCVSSIL